MNLELQSEITKLRAEFKTLLDSATMDIPFHGDDMAGLRSPDILPSNYSSPSRVIAFGCTNTGLVINIKPGKLYFKGVSLTISNWPNGNNVTITDTTFGYISIDLANATATWATAGSDPGNGNDDTEIWRIFAATVTDGVITELLECQHGDIHTLGNA